MCCFCCKVPDGSKALARSSRREREKPATTHDLCLTKLGRHSHNRFCLSGVWVMLVQASVGHSAHVVVLGNEKGGSGKSTTAMHVAVALMKAGQRVATIDLDCRQQSFSRYIENRRAWIERSGICLQIPKHFCIAAGDRIKH